MDRTATHMCYSSRIWHRRCIVRPFFSRRRRLKSTFPYTLPLPQTTTTVAMSFYWLVVCLLLSDHFLFCLFAYCVCVCVCSMSTVLFNNKAMNGGFIIIVVVVNVMFHRFVTSLGAVKRTDTRANDTRTATTRQHRDERVMTTSRSAVHCDARC